LIIVKYRDLQGLSPQEAVALVYGVERARDDLIVVLTDCIDEKGGCPIQALPGPGSD
jgi:hypothetical protein